MFRAAYRSSSGALNCICSFKWINQTDAAINYRFIACLL